ncbi:MAG: squalene--hopene cyclase [Planctomycetes bacterium]|nr:squalene--hopene cyclase [Planctomycetota bacterium]
MISTERLEAAYQTALAALLKERTPDGHWVGELSTSALSTATAVMALHLVQKNGDISPNRLPGRRLGDLIDGGLAWLAAHQNDDGGWGDTTVSFSNISTTMLCRSAFYMTAHAAEHSEAAGSNPLTPCPSPPEGRGGEYIARAEAWLRAKYGQPTAWPEAIRQRYGVDRTFATPILTTCALAGLVSWDEVPPLPFELAVLPQSWFRFVRLHVVSYALPALIAIGQCIYYHKKPWNPITLLVRWLSRKRTLNVLRSIQPSSGGFLEAIPLTSFVTLSLAASGLANHPVTQDGVRFIANSVRPDGSWAIDSNLATWVTTLSINALAAAGELDKLDRKDALRDWLLKQQYKDYHPYTGADAGGWAWTDLPGGVPDADDTPGAILALEALGADEKTSAALDAARGWLWYLQNNDGGTPTFCRGWGNLPFDRSGCDLTAHAVRAMTRPIREWQPTFWTLNPDGPWFIQFADAGLEYLRRSQRPDGSWLPLWFGNQHMPDDENPTYGTSRVLAAYRDLGMMDTEPAKCGIAWLFANQNPDGGWGGGLGSPSSIEETALALDVLVDPSPAPSASDGPTEAPRLRSGLVDAVNKGIAWLVEKLEKGGLSHPTPIGFYFAKLWYYEKLYPIIFTVSALGRARKSNPPRTESV